MKAGRQVPVLAVTQVVNQGDTLTAADVTTVRLSASAGVRTIPADEIGVVVGQRASVKLEPASLLVPADLTTSMGPPAGTAVVGVEVKASQLPASGLQPGDTVDAVLTGIPGASTSSIGPTGTTPVGGVGTGPEAPEPGTVLAAGVTVTDVAVSSPSAGTDTTVISLLVPSTLAPLIASASAAGQVALVVVPSVR